MINDKLIRKLLNIENKEIKKDNTNQTEAKKQKIINTIIIDSSKINSFEFNSSYKQIECLSLRNNYIRNISFLRNLPNLYYLDLFGNHIDNYKPLIKLGTFGFLSLSPPKNYFEKKILSLKQLNIIIFEVDITDKSIYNNLIVGNPNIFVFNNSIIEFSRKVRIFNTVIGLRYYIHNLLSDNKEMKMLKKSNQNYNNIKNKTKKKDESISFRDIIIEKKLKSKHNSVMNPKCLEINNFFDEYNNILFNLFKANKSKYNEDILLNEERKKILMIYKTLNNISKYFCKTSRNNPKLFEENKETMIKKSNYHFNKFPMIDIQIFECMEFLQYKEFVLSVILLYLLSVFSKDISLYLISLIFRKTKYFYEHEEHKSKVNETIESLFYLNKVYLFSYYYKIYDILFGNTEEMFNNENLYNIKKRLNMISIADKIQELLSNQENFIKNFHSNENVSQKNKIVIDDFIEFLFHMKIFPVVFNIFQFVNDFLIFNKLYNKLESVFPEDIHFFCEIQGLLLIYYNKFSEVDESIADKNYDKIQNKFLLGNKFFFKRVKSKEKTIPYLIPPRKRFYPNKKRIDNIDNFKPLHELKKEREKFLKQNYINNALKQYLIVKGEKKEHKNRNNLRFKLLNNNYKKEINFNNGDENDKKFYKTYNFSFMKNNNNFNLDHSIDKTKTFFYSNTQKALAKSNLKNIKNLKTLNIAINNNKKKYKFFNNHLLSNHFDNDKKDFNSFRNKLNEFIQKKEKYKNEKSNILTSFDENNDIDNEKELKQLSLSIDTKIKAKYYSIREFKEGYIVSHYYNKDNDRYENIKTSIDSLNQKKYNRTPKFTDLYF